MWTIEFWKAAGERAIKTAAQSAASALASAGVGTLIGLDWRAVASMSGFGALTSILTSIASGAVTGGDTSLTGAETLAPRHLATGSDSQ
ncbi:MAG: holin [Propionibacteriaceae bacterium]|jgi:hypothetical protein|nr:holin [Propionibacteriaceae bacterium]